MWVVSVFVQPADIFLNASRVYNLYSVNLSHGLGGAEKAVNPFHYDEDIFWTHFLVLCAAGASWRKVVLLKILDMISSFPQQERRTFFYWTLYCCYLYCNMLLACTVFEVPSDITASSNLAWSSQIWHIFLIVFLSHVIIMTDVSCQKYRVLIKRCF